MKAFMAALLLTFTASSALAATTTWQTGETIVEKERMLAPAERAQQPHGWYGGDLYHGGNQ